MLLMDLPSSVMEQRVLLNLLRVYKLLRNVRIFIDLQIKFYIFKGSKVKSDNTHNHQT